MIVKTEGWLVLEGYGGMADGNLKVKLKGF